MKNKIFNSKESVDWSIISKYRDEIFGFTMISIVIFHFFENVLNSEIIGTLHKVAQAYNISISSVGVEIFLFLSGMGLFFSMKKNNDVKLFYIKRLKRLLIPYLIIGGIFWFIKDIIILKSNFTTFMYDYTILSFWFKGIRCVWFIGFILLMYLIYPILFKCFDGNKRQRDCCLVLLLLINIGLAEGLRIISPTTYSHIEIAIWRIPIFILGAYMAKKIYRHESFDVFDKLLVVAGLIIKFAAILLQYIDTPIPNIFKGRLGTCVFSISLIVITSFLLSKIKFNFLNILLKKVGALSLELYITHVTIRNLMNSCNMPTYIFLNYFVCILLSVILSILLNKLIGKLTRNNKSNNNVMNTLQS